MFLGENLLAYLVLALGAALTVGNVMALIKPPPNKAEGDLEKAPVVRSVLMAVVGAIAAIWSIASLVNG
jgi:hypothetical protein